MEVISIIYNFDMSCMLQNFYHVFLDVACVTHTLFIKVLLKILSYQNEHRTEGKMDLINKLFGITIT